MTNKKLYFFTGTFPFEHRESFIETEILYLSKSFQKITIIPLFGQPDFRRNVPGNSEVHLPVVRNNWHHYICGLFSLKAFPFFIKDLFRGKVYRNRRRLKAFFIAYCSTNNLLQSRALRSALHTIQSGDILYFYWGVGSTYLLPYFSFKNAKIVVRFHGEWDLYEEVSGGDLIPKNCATQNVNFVAKFEGGGRPG